MPLPVMRPKLPNARRIVSSLEAIDRSRIYSNFGPLTLSLEDRLAEHFGLSQGTVATVANATLGLAIALAMQQPPVGSLCAMPAWTFVASAHAATMAGLVPYFVDVDPKTWALDIGKLEKKLAQAPSQIGAVMPVMPFGSPLDIASWDAFRSRTGLAIVIDAAAGFDTLVPGAVPAVVSLHATKVLGVGEGGFIISTDATVQRAVRLRSNFGFDGSRLAQSSAFNAKLSEYHAAVGHAALDEWTEARNEWSAAAAAYRQTLSGDSRVSIQPGFGETWIGSTCMLGFTELIAERVAHVLKAHDIETRSWWGAGAHRHPATASFPRSPVPITDTLARATLSVPFHRDIDLADIDRVCAAIVSALDTVQ